MGGLEALLAKQTHPFFLHHRTAIVSPAGGRLYGGVTSAFVIGSGSDAELAAAREGERLRERGVG